MDLSLILMGGGVLAVVLLVFGLVVSAGEDRALLDKRVDRYWEAEEQAGGGKGERSSPIADWINTQAERQPWGAGIAKDLARADLKMKVGEYLALTALSCLTLAALGFGLGGNDILLGLVGGVTGLFLPKVYVKSQQGKRLTKFNDQLADMLNLMVNGLRAGYSTMQAMEAVSREMPAPICDETRRVVQEMQLGVSMENALDNLLRRIPSEDLDLVITAMNVQREVGGNLAEILSNISFTIRERIRIKGEIRVLTSQVRYSGRFLSVLPIMVVGALYLTSPGYFLTFFDEPKFIGIGALVISAVMIISGYFVMEKIGAIEV
jgi:tight adherence protein B